MKPPARFELKFWASEAQVASVLADLGGLLERDPHASDAAPSYLVTSLYYDTRDRAAFLDKLEGLREREKVRLRRYGTAPEGWAELKVKRGAKVRKWRTPLDAEALAAVARGDGGPLAGLADEPARRFLNAFAVRPLEPVILTRYAREAWRGIDDPTVRITVDRGLAGGGEPLVERFLTEDPGALSLEELPVWGPAVLEVKTNGPVPRAVAEALRAAGLRRRAISKYCLALAHTRRLPPGLERQGATYLRTAP